MKGKTKSKLRDGELTLGTWIMMGHRWIAEILSGEDFDWICADMEHTSIDVKTFEEIAIAAKDSSCDVFARLSSCDPVQAKLVLDAGANGIIVPSINSREEAELAVKMAKFPPAGIRGTALSRATDYGRNFEEYYKNHNDNVVVVIMLEHIDAVKNVDEILSVEGIDATLIGPYDLSASMGLAGKLRHPDVEAAQKKLLDACKRYNIPPGIHIVPPDADLIRQRIEEGYKFISCSIDTAFLMVSARKLLEEIRK